MSPEDLAKLHPHLYHVTDPSALDGIKRHGLLSTSNLLTLFEVQEPARALIERVCRPGSVTLKHPEHGYATIADNAPLNEQKLAKCLDDGLVAADWLRKLNERVFFWSNKHRLDAFLDAQLNRNRPRLVLVFDTLRLAKSHASRMELAPFNTGSTAYTPTRRGLSTFTPLERYSYAEWRKLRKNLRQKLDNIVEVTVIGSVANAAEFLVEHYSAVGNCKQRIEPPSG
jgi:hypothetical protein